MKLQELSFAQARSLMPGSKILHNGHVETLIWKSHKPGSPGGFGGGDSCAYWYLVFRSGLVAKVGEEDWFKKGKHVSIVQRPDNLNLSHVPSKD